MRCNNYFIFLFYLIYTKKIKIEIYNNFERNIFIKRNVIHFIIYKLFCIMYNWYWYWNIIIN